MLEKILEEIERYIKAYNEPPYGRAVQGTVELLTKCKDIIREYIDKDINVPSNDVWIPVEDGLPEVAEELDDDCCQEFNVTIEGATESTTLKYSADGTWFDEYGNCYDVIAWQPLPEPYKGGE